MTRLLQRWACTLAVLLLCVSGMASAQSFPALTGRVVDEAHLLSADQVAQLTQLSASVEQASTRQLVVATVASLQGYPIEDFGYKLGRAWKIGQAGANNGIILLVAPNERRVRIEVGYGLEPYMTDALSSVIVNDTITPRFKAGDMGGGVVAGAQEIAAQLKLPPDQAEQRAKRKIADSDRARRSSVNWGSIIFWGVILAFFVLPMFRRRSGQRFGGGGLPVVLWGGGGGWGSGGGGSSWGDGGGGGFSGGGGSFGGGGASGSW